MDFGVIVNEQEIFYSFRKAVIYEKLLICEID